MMFFLLAAFAVLIAAVKIRLQRVGDPAVIRNALVRGGLSYLAIWILGTGVFGPASPLKIPGVPPDALVDALWILSTLLALVLWTALVEVAFHRFRRRDLVWVVPFGFASVLLAMVPDLLASTLAAIPALVRVRWRREVSSSTLTVASLVGFLFVLLFIVSFQVAGNPFPESGLIVQMVRFSHWILALTVTYLLLALPRLAWGMNLQIQSVRVRLLVSHTLAGLVPVVLVLVFWALSTYLSVTGDRALVAARHLDEEALAVGQRLEAALAEGDAGPSGLKAWAKLEGSRYPGIRVWTFEPSGSSPSNPSTAGSPAAIGSSGRTGSPTATGSPGMAGTPAASGSPGGAGANPPPAGTWTRIQGAPVPGEEGLASWPDSLPQEGVVLLDGEAFVGAVRRRSDPDGGPAGAALFIPVSSVLGPDLVRRLDATAFLDTRVVVEPDGRGFTVLPDTLSGANAPPERSESGFSMGAALIDVLEYANGEWRLRSTLLHAQVGLWQALRGLTRNLKENPFNAVPLFFLAIVALLFVLVEVLTLGMVISMGRSITRALSSLLQGTTRLREGNLRYRIPIEGKDDLWEVSESFNRMAVNLEEARDLEIERKRLEGELALAHQIQARLLPAEAPVLPRTELAGLSLPAREVGGDYYDFLPLSNGSIGLIVADVSGKGVPAALLMSSFRASLLSQKLESGPAEILTRLNHFLHRSVEPGRFVTAFLAMFNPKDGRLIYANAGHNPPYWLGADGRLSTLKEGGLVLGLFGETSYEQAEIQLADGDLLALFTDGVTEAQNAEEELWGEDRLEDVLRDQRGAPCRRIVSEILGEIRRFAGEEAQSDDITLLLARWRGQDGGRPGGAFGPAVP